MELATIAMQDVSSVKVLLSRNAKVQVAKLVTQKSSMILQMSMFSLALKVVQQDSSKMSQEDATLVMEVV